MKALLRPAFVFGLSIAIAATSLVGSSSVALSANLAITSLSLGGSVYEGDRPFLNGTFTGGAGHGPYTVDVDWSGDGDFEDMFSFDALDAGTFTVQKTVPYVNEQTNVTIVVVLSDPSFTNRKNMLGIAILNAAPKFTSFGLSATDVDAGQAVAATGAFTDGGANDTHTVTLNWGDLTAPTTTPPAAGAFTSDPHTYTDAGDFTVTATVTDNAGATAVATATVTVHVPNQAPNILSFGVTAGSEGGNSTLALTFADADALDTHTVVSVSWGDGSPSDPALKLAPGEYTFEATHVYADSGTYAVELTLSDSANHTVTVDASVSPTNAAPVLGSLTLSPTSLVDHQTLTVSGSFTDPSTADTFTLTVAWGDGSSDTQLLGTARSFSATHSYDEAGPVTITATVEDSDHATSSSSAVLLVESSNHAPADLALDATVNGSNATVNGGFTTADADDTHTVTMSWGDDTSTSQFLAAGTTTFDVSHVYGASGTYTVEATVTDQAGASTSARTEVVVTVSAGSASDVIDEMITLVRSFELDRNTERWLVKKLTDMNSSLAYGNTQVCSSTGTLAHIVAFAQRTLPDDQYTELRAFATRLEAAAGCTSSGSQQTSKAQKLAAVTTTTVTPAPTQKKDAAAKDEKKAAKSASKSTVGRGSSH